jgi:hypothetical protein
MKYSFQQRLSLLITSLNFNRMHLDMYIRHVWMAEYGKGGRLLDIGLE